MAKNSAHLQTLRRYQKWRREARVDANTTDPSSIGAALDYAIAVVEAAENLINVKGRHHSETAYRRLEEAVRTEPTA